MSLTTSLIASVRKISKDILCCDTKAITVNSANCADEGLFSTTVVVRRTPAHTTHMARMQLHEPGDRGVKKRFSYFPTPVSGMR